MPKKLTNQIFSQVLARAQDITDSFDIDLGKIPEDVVASHRQADSHVQNVRDLMEASWLAPDTDLSTVDHGLVDMVAWAEVHGAPVQQAYKRGDVVAIDGTPLVPFQRFLTAQVYACTENI
jgi:hypothetical protein